MAPSREILLVLLVSALLMSVLVQRKPPVRYEPDGGPLEIKGVRLGMTRKELEDRLGPPMFGPDSLYFAVGEHERVSPMMNNGRTSLVLGRSVEQSTVTLIRVGDSASRVRTVFQGRCQRSGADNRWQYTLKGPGSLVVFLGHRSHRVECCSLQ